MAELVPKEVESAAAGEAEVVAPALEEGEVVYILPDLDDNIVSLIAAALPTKDAYRFTILSSAHKDLVKAPSFLMAHLKPQALLVGDKPGFVVFQPAGRLCYTHLTVAKLMNDLNNPVFFNLAVKEDGDPKSGDRLLYPVPGAAPGPKFFEETVHLLDVAIVASHERLLLARGSHYYVCNPADNRWVKLPLPTTVTERLQGTTAGLCYGLDDAGEVHFTVIPLVHHNRGILVQKFLSSVGTWDEKEVGIHGATDLLPLASPGIVASKSFYWLSQSCGRLVCYDAVTGCLSAVDEPPAEAKYPTRAGRSLGSTGGKLRFSSCDRSGESSYGLEVQGVAAALKVWEMGKSREWHLTHLVVLDDPAWLYTKFCNLELPVDFAGASSSLIMVKKGRSLMARDLENGDTWFVTDLYHGEELHNFYKSVDLFPFYM